MVTGVNQDARVWVGGLPSKYEEDDVHDHFKSFGAIDSVRIIHGQKDSYCFVQFENDFSNLHEHTDSNGF